MAQLNEKYPGDLDVMALYAESLMTLNPWAMWTKEADSTDIIPADENTVVVKAILERVSNAATWPFLGGSQSGGILPSADSPVIYTSMLK